MPNADLAARILHAITEHPEHYDQGHLFHGVETLHPGDQLTDGALDCGTTLCIAGYATHLTGHTLTLTDAIHDEGVTARKPGHPPTPVFEAARDELQLTEDDAAWLFWGARTPAQARAALQQLAAGAHRIDQSSTARAFPTLP